MIFNTAIRNRRHIVGVAMLVTAAPLVALGATSSFASVSITQRGSDVDGTGADDGFGTSVDISSSGSVIAIAAPYSDNVGSEDGVVHIYVSSASTLTELGSGIVGDGGDVSGEGIALSGDGTRIAIGSRYYNGNAGRVRVYEWNGTAWLQMGSGIGGESAGDYSGGELDISDDGSRVVIGAPNNSASASRAGQVRVFEWNGWSWGQVGVDIDGAATDDNLGSAVSISADGATIAVGSSGASSSGGRVGIYTWTGSSWTLRGSNILAEASGDYSGDAVSLSADGTFVAIGAPYNAGSATESGQVRVFEWTGTAWSQVGSDIDGDALGDYAGTSVAIAASGMRVAFGAPYNHSGSTQPGQARVYDWNGTSWVQVGTDLNGEGDGDAFGQAIAMSTDGTRMIVGGPNNDGGAANAGHARIFDLSAVTPITTTTTTTTTVAETTTSHQSTTTSGEPELPFTGSDTPWLAMFAVTLVALGSVRFLKRAAK